MTVQKVLKVVIRTSEEGVFAPSFMHMGLKDFSYYGVGKRTLPLTPREYLFVYANTWHTKQCINERYKISDQLNHFRVFTALADIFCEVRAIPERFIDDPKTKEVLFSKENKHFAAIKQPLPDGLFRSEATVFLANWVELLKDITHEFIK